MTAPEKNTVPPHIWLFLTAAALLLLAIPHAILALVFALPNSALVDMHLVLTVLVALAGWRAEHEHRRKRNEAGLDDLSRRLSDDLPRPRSSKNSGGGGASPKPSSPLRR